VAEKGQLNRVRRGSTADTLENSRDWSTQAKICSRQGIRYEKQVLNEANTEQKTDREDLYSHQALKITSKRPLHYIVDYSHLRSSSRQAHARRGGGAETPHPGDLTPTPPPTTDPPTHNQPPSSDQGNVCCDEYDHYDSFSRKFQLLQSHGQPYSTPSSVYVQDTYQLLRPCPLTTIRWLFILRLSCPDGSDTLLGTGPSSRQYFRRMTSAGLPSTSMKATFLLSNHH
jgi:hypothetical protein